MFRYNEDDDNDTLINDGKDIITLFEYEAYKASIDAHNFEVMRGQLPLYTVEDLPIIAITIH